MQILLPPKSEAMGHYSLFSFFFWVPLVHSGSSYEAFVRVREVRRNDILWLCRALLISTSLAAADTLPLEVAIRSKQELYFHNYNALKSCV